MGGPKGGLPPFRPTFPNVRNDPPFNFIRKAYHPSRTRTRKVLRFARTLCVYTHHLHYFPPLLRPPPLPPPPAPSVLRPPPVSGRMVGQYVEYFVQGQTFICPAEYELLKPIGKGAYGVVCSARHIPSGTPVCPFRFLSPSPSATSRPLFWSPHNHEDEPFIEYNQLIVPSGRDVAIKRIGKAFDNVIDAKRTLREVKLLRHFRSFTTHENIIQVRVVAKNT